MVGLLYSVIFLGFPIFTICDPVQHSENDPYLHKEILDSKGNYHLEWQVDWKLETVRFTVTVRTQGYVALGLSQNGRMPGADIVIGGVRSNGSLYFNDYHAIGNQKPILDQKQHWILHSARENSSHTFLSFSRAFGTCDKQDVPINDNSVYIIWAYGETDNINEYHFQNRGAFITYLRDPDLTPRSIHEFNRKNSSGTPPELGDGNDGIQRWSIQERFTIPAKRTTYWCNMQKFMVPGKRHVIGTNVRINPEAQLHLHHMLLMRCTPPPQINPRSIYEPLVNFPGEECYDLVQPIGSIQTQFCTELILGHSIGGNPFFLPEHVGTPIGDRNSEEYYLLQVHYDNPTMRPNITVELDIDIYYTDRLRKHDEASLNIGQHVPGSPSVLLPPGEMNHRIHGHCSEACTRKMFPSGGIRVFAAMLHSHNAGRKLKIQHFRNGRELPWMLGDDNYKFQFQTMRLLRNEVVVLPGDELIMTCVYDTTTSNKTVVGGYGTDQEMCQGFLRYYNKLDEYPTCRTELRSPSYTMRYLAGTLNFTWDQSRLENMATAPAHLAGMTISEISDSRYVNWNISQRASLQRDHIVHPQVDICPSLTEVAAALLLGLRPPLTFSTYPVQAQEIEPENRCTL